MIGRQIAQYEVVEKLGEGGMGAVYKARDHRLDRFVALKVLSGPATKAADSALLDKEAKAASALNHPNIATIHDTGQYEGRPYLVFEYLPGGTLLQRLRQAGGKLGLEDILRFAREAGSGLAHAHRRGVVHRDIKTENMMLSDEGQVKITDFGLAVRGASRDTGNDDAAAGTAPYMSPEQGEAEEVDARSDIFSFGISLYELATGRVPFEGPHPAAIAYDIVHTPTPSITKHRADLPEALNLIVQRATEKRPGDRYQSMDELLADLSAVQQAHTTGSLPRYVRPADTLSTRERLLYAGAAAAIAAAIAVTFLWPGLFEPGLPDGPVSIAVLPFENISGDVAQDFLAEGLTEALITDLAKAPSLRVKSRASILPYRDSGRTLREIGAELGVDRIVEGTVLRMGERIRIAAQLIDARRDVSLWAESFEYDASDILKLQQEVAAAVAGEVQQKLSPPGGAAANRSIDPAAYAAYVRGRMAAFEWTLEGSRQALAEFTRAIEIEPDFAEAHAGAALAYGFLSLHGVAAPAELWPQARQAADRALAIDPSLDQAHVALGFVAALYDWDFETAEQEFRRALELNPGSIDARHALAMTVLAANGRIDEALAAIREAVDLDPLSAPVRSNYGDLLVFAGDARGAREQYERTLGIRPEFAEALRGLGLLALRQGRPAEGAVYLERFAEADPENEVAPVFAMIARGASSAARERLVEIESAAETEGGFHRWWLVAVAWASLGDRQKTLDSLERAAEVRNSQLVTLKVMETFARLRQEPRFQAILERLNLAESESR